MFETGAVFLHGYDKEGNKLCMSTFRPAYIFHFPMSSFAFNRQAICSINDRIGCFVLFSLVQSKATCQRRKNSVGQEEVCRLLAGAICKEGTWNAAYCCVWHGRVWHQQHSKSLHTGTLMLFLLNGYKNVLLFSSSQAFHICKSELELFPAVPLKSCWLSHIWAVALQGDWCSSVAFYSVD